MLGKEFKQAGVGRAAIKNDAARTPASSASRAVWVLGIIPPAMVPSAVMCSNLRWGQLGQHFAFSILYARNISQKQQAIRLEGGSNSTSSGVAIDVKCLTIACPSQAGRSRG